MQLDFTKLGESGYSNGHAIFIPQLVLTVNGAVTNVQWVLGDLQTSRNILQGDLNIEREERQNNVQALSNAITAEAKLRSDADGKHTNAIAQEVFDRGAGDLANAGAITQEIADRKAAITVVSNSASANALAITAETKAREAKDALLDTAIADEKKRALAVEGSLYGDIQSESNARNTSISNVYNDLGSEANRAVAAETKLGERIDFITHNTNPAAIDSLSEIVAQFSTNGQGYADRLTYLEGVIEALVNQSQ
jgi:hypothetical protein